MSDPKDPTPPPDVPNLDPEDTVPAFDRVAARARYRALMRGPFMRGVGILTVAVILLAWAFGAASAFAPNVQNLPNHDITVPVSACVSCHNRALPVRPNNAPPMNHWNAPSCGFCHRQGLPVPSGP